MKLQTPHQSNVEKFLRGIGRLVPDFPRAPDVATRAAWARLLLEEVFEWIEAAGLGVLCEGGGVAFKDLSVSVDGWAEPNLVKMVDASADISVVNTGALSLCGVADSAILDEVDENNLLKIGRGRMDPVSGKFIKPPDHPRPDFEKRLRLQGWKGPGQTG
jgi:predicted HAD superfamily Cof-like phosphohydrolase